MVTTSAFKQCAGVAHDWQCLLLLILAWNIWPMNIVAGDKNFNRYEQPVPEGMPIVLKPIPAGEFTMGSPAAEPGREDDEGPQHQVRVGAFWMSQCEITWGQYRPFMEPPSHPSDPQNVDGVTRPTPIGWHLKVLNMGMKDNQPVAGITQYAAKQFCSWLSAETGYFYRLPTEAEWEYACRAGTTSAYHFGEEAKRLSDYAWFTDDDDPAFVDGYQLVMQKLPNRWGLYDMHGNVAEWVLDGYDKAAYQQRPEASADSATPWTQPRTLFSRVVRGGSWQDSPADLRSAARRASEPSWREPDPSLPKSRWHLRSGEFVGFRIVRPLAVPTEEDRLRAAPDKFQLE